MEWNELKAVLAQVLDNYRRCGVSHLSRSVPPLSDQLLLQLADMREAAAHPALTATSASPAETAINVTVPPPPAAAAVESVPRADPRTSAETTSAGNSLAPVIPGNWQLPVVDLSRRQTELDAIHQAAVACRLCTDIVNFRQQVVMGVGKLNPRICFMGEAPGGDEDRVGEPFVGRAGQLLTKIIGAMQLKREDVYILNALKCRPPENRTPVPDEIANCRPFVLGQLEILQPEFIVCLGAVAAQSLLNSTQPIGRMRGRFHQFRGARVVVTYHPSYLLRNESAKRLVWEDMKMLMAQL